MLIFGWGSSGQSAAEAVVTYQRMALDRLLARRRRMFPVVHQLASRMGPIRLGGLRSPFFQAQLDILRDLVVASHDEGKALLIALAPLFDDASMKSVWLDLRRSGPNLMKAGVVEDTGYRFDTRLTPRTGRERERSQVS